jgi:hypothetical protein
MAEFADEIAALELFNEKATKLCQLRFTDLIRNRSLSLSIKWSHDCPTLVEHSLPDSEATDAFILTWRFFILQAEPCSFRALAKVYERVPVAADLTPRFVDARARFNALRHESAQVGFSAERLLNYEELENILLYGGLAHASNKELREQFKIIMSCESVATFVLFQFCNYLGEALSIICEVAKLNAETRQYLLSVT